MQAEEGLSLFVSEGRGLAAAQQPLYFVNGFNKQTLSEYYQHAKQMIALESVEGKKNIFGIAETFCRENNAVANILGPTYKQLVGGRFFINPNPELDVLLNPIMKDIAKQQKKNGQVNEATIQSLTLALVESLINNPHIIPSSVRYAAQLIVSQVQTCLEVPAINFEHEQVLRFASVALLNRYLCAYIARMAAVNYNSDSSAIVRLLAAPLQKSITRVDPAREDHVPDNPLTVPVTRLLHTLITPLPECALAMNIEHRTAYNLLIARLRKITVDSTHKHAEIRLKRIHNYEAGDVSPPTPEKLDRLVRHIKQVKRNMGAKEKKQHAVELESLELLKQSAKTLKCDVARDIATNIEHVLGVEKTEPATDTHILKVSLLLGVPAAQAQSLIEDYQQQVLVSSASYG